jgi:hypothetical protein
MAPTSRRDLGEAREVDLARVGGGAAEEQLGLVLTGE